MWRVLLSRFLFSLFYCVLLEGGKLVQIEDTGKKNENIVGKGVADMILILPCC